MSQEFRIVRARRERLVRVANWNPPSSPRARGVEEEDAVPPPSSPPRTIRHDPTVSEKLDILCDRIGYLTRIISAVVPAIESMERRTKALQTQIEGLERDNCALREAVQEVRASVRNPPASTPTPTQPQAGSVGPSRPTTPPPPQTQPPPHQKRKRAVEATPTKPKPTKQAREVSPTPGMMHSQHAGTPEPPAPSNGGGEWQRVERKKKGKGKTGEKESGNNRREGKGKQGQALVPTWAQVARGGGVHINVFMGGSKPREARRRPKKPKKEKDNGGQGTGRLQAETSRMPKQAEAGRNEGPQSGSKT